MSTWNMSSRLRLGSGRMNRASGGITAGRIGARARSLGPVTSANANTLVVRPAGFARARATAPPTWGGSIDRVWRRNANGVVCCSFHQKPARSVARERARPNYIAARSIRVAGERRMATSVRRFPGNAAFSSTVSSWSKSSVALSSRTRMSITAMVTRQTTVPRTWSSGQSASHTASDQSNSGTARPAPAGRA